MTTTIKQRLTKAILPSTLAAIGLIAFFFIDERSTPREFEDEYYSNSDFLMFIAILAVVGSIFKFTTDRIMGDRVRSVRQHVISILLLASLFLALFVTVAMINGKFPGDIFIEVTLLVLALGTLIQVLSLVFSKFFSGSKNRP